MMHAKPERPVTVQGDLRNLPAALAPLTALPNWVCWKWEWRVDKKGVGKWTKPPHRPDAPHRYAKNNDSRTWGTHEQAVTAFEAGQCDGIGFCLAGSNVSAFDLDNARDPATGSIALEAVGYVGRAASYTEISVSGTGLHVIGTGSGDKVHCKQKVPGSDVEVESYRGAERYIVVTGKPLPQTWPHMANIDGVIDAVVAELAGHTAGNGKADKFDFEPQAETLDTGDAVLPADLINLIDKPLPPQDDRSRAFHHAVCWLKDLGWTVSRIEARIAGKPIAEKYDGRLREEIARCLHKAKPKAQQQTWNAPRGNGLGLEDFYAYMPRHQYIFVPTREMWPGSSVNTRLPKVPLFKKNGSPLADENGDQKHSKPSDWLDKHRPVEQMTWAPGEPLTVDGRLMAEGGWFDRPGTTTFNMYRPPAVRQGNSAGADRWVELVQRIYPDDADHIIAYCAHRIQHPAVKINHGILLGGSTGIGKDTILEPLKLGVGPWNFKEVSPQDIMSSYNDYMQCVVLRISEAHDLGDINRYAFHDHMKTILAAPPDVIRVNGKYMPQHYVLNVAGVIYTTNNRFDSVYLPPNDRRTYVAWSEIQSADFVKEFWTSFYGWYAAGGLEDVVAYLAEYDLAEFDAKAPPRKTEAFWQIVGAGAAPENSELADILDALGAKENLKDVGGEHHGPVATTLAKVIGEAQGDLFEWLKDRKNRRVLSHRFEACGYAAVRNPDAKDGMWVIGGKRQMVYARMDVAPAEQLKAAQRLTSNR